jgi:hypothetical protein
VAGERPVFITAGWGREPLYAYAAAAVFSLAGDMVLGMRLTTVMFSMIFLAVAYVTAHRLFNRAIALMTLAWLAGGFWPLMTSRAGERNICWRCSRPSRFMCSACPCRRRGLGLGRRCLGVTLWTYQSSRVMPLVFVAFGVYLAVTQRSTLRTNWKGMVVFLLIGLLVASPLLAYVATHPGAETGDFKTQSLSALQQGDVRPMIAAALGALGLFTVRGELYWLHNIPGRPILDWLSGILFYLGLIATIWRWKHAEYALILLWLAIGLVPAMVTDPPSHHRMANVMAAAYTLPALGADWIGRALHTQRHAVYALVMVALLAFTGLITARDWFGIWAVSPEVKDLRFSPLAQLSRDLDRDPGHFAVVVAGTYIEDRAVGASCVDEAT